ncbi:hypothetical protein [Haladaptatus sp. DFWS20]
MMRSASTLKLGKHVQTDKRTPAPTIRTYRETGDGRRLLGRARVIGRTSQ